MKPTPTRRRSPRHAEIGRGRAPTPGLLDFVTRLLSREDPTLRRIRERIPAEGLPPISIGPDEGRLLDFLVKACGAGRALEIGTLAGYSGSWIARALPPGGRLHTLEIDPRCAQVARRNFQLAGVEGKVVVHLGPALETLAALAAEAPFDFCFIDADKPNYPHYLAWAARLLRPGGIVAGDNAYLFGKLHLKASKAGDAGPAIEAMREFLSGLTTPETFSSCAMIPTGEGLAVAVRR